MKFIVINPEQMQSVVQSNGRTKTNKTKSKTLLSKSLRQKEQTVLASNRYPNKKKKSTVAGRGDSLRLQ